MKYYYDTRFFYIENGVKKYVYDIGLISYLSKIRINAIVYDILHTDTYTVCLVNKEVDNIELKQ